MENENEKLIIGWRPEIGFYTLAKDGKEAEHILDRSDGKERVARFSFISRQLRWLQGEILTIAEATISDQRQLAATKELIKDKFSAKISWIYELCGMPNDEQEGLDDDSGYALTSTKGTSIRA